MPSKERNDRYKAEGKCTNCKNPPKKGYGLCEKHLRLNCESSKKQKSKRKLENRCRVCGRFLIDIGNGKSNITCIVCIESRAFRKRLNW